MKRLYKILCLMTMLMFLLIIVQHWGIIRERDLSGAAVKTKFPRFSVSAFRSGEWQHDMDEWAKNNHGFRRTAIRCYNQYLWSVFRLSNNQQVMVGKDGVLFERYFVEDYYGKRMYDYAGSADEFRQVCEREAKRVARLQQVLKEKYNTTLLFVIPPGKDRIYPENLPQVESMKHFDGLKAYDLYPALFEQYGVNCIDFCDWFRSWRDSIGYDVLCPHGTHWSNIASVYAFDSIRRRLQELDGPAIPAIAIGQPYTDAVRDPDYDLEALMNIYHMSDDTRYQYVDVTVLDTTTRRPRLLVVGDSYYMVIQRNIPLNQLFEYEHFWFYNSTVFGDTAHHKVEEVDMAQELREADYVIMSFCTGQLYDFREFPKQSLFALFVSPERVQQVRDGYVRDIYNTPEWIAKIRQQSVEQGITEKAAIENNVQWMINENFDQLFPEIGL